MKRIILVGKAGSGKDFFKDYMRMEGHECDVSYTTRPQRKGEVEGVTYHYISEEVFNKYKLEGLFYEDVEFNGWKYATTKRDWVERKLCIKTPSGIAQLTDQDLEESIVIYFDVPLEERRERLLKRSDADKVDRRIAADESDFKDFKLFNIRITSPVFDTQVLDNVIYEFDLI